MSTVFSIFLLNTLPALTYIILKLVNLGWELLKVGNQELLTHLPCNFEKRSLAGLASRKKRPNFCVACCIVKQASSITHMIFPAIIKFCLQVIIFHRSMNFFCILHHNIKRTGCKHLSDGKKAQVSGQFDGQVPCWNVQRNHFIPCSCFCVKFWLNSSSNWWLSLSVGPSVFSMLSCTVSVIAWPFLD